MRRRSRRGAPPSFVSWRLTARRLTGCTPPEVFKHYSDFIGVTEATGRRGRDGFYPKAALDPDAIVGVDAINADAVAFKYMAAPLSKEQLAELIQIPPR